MEPTLALDNLVQITRQHVVVATTDVREVVTFEECVRSNESGTTVAVPEGLRLRDPMSKQRSRPDDAFGRGCLYCGDFAQAAEEWRSLIESKRTRESLVLVDAAVEVSELLDAGNEQ